MKHQVVFLDRQSVKATVRRPRCADTYIAVSYTHLTLPTIYSV